LRRRDPLPGGGKKGGNCSVGRSEKKKEGYPPMGGERGNLGTKKRASLKCEGKRLRYNPGKRGDYHRDRRKVSEGRGE